MTSSGDAGGAPPEPRAVVAGHGDFAAGIISAVQLITGMGNRFRGLSNTTMDATALDVALRDAVLAMGATVVFTDLPAGSCTVAARRLTRELPELAVVTGANLPMLLEFALKGGATRASAARAADRGREAIAVAAPVSPPEGDRAH